MPIGAVPPTPIGAVPSTRRRPAPPEPEAEPAAKRPRVGEEPKVRQPPARPSQAPLTVPSGSRGFLRPKSSPEVVKSKIRPNDHPGNGQGGSFTERQQQKAKAERAAREEQAWNVQYTDYAALTTWQAVVDYCELWKSCPPGRVPTAFGFLSKLFPNSLTTEILDLQAALELATKKAASDKARADEKLSLIHI